MKILAEIDIDNHIHNNNIHDIQELCYGEVSKYFREMAFIIPGFNHDFWHYQKNQNWV